MKNQTESSAKKRKRLGRKGTDIENKAETFEKNAKQREGTQETVCAFRCPARSGTLAAQRQNPNLPQADDGKRAFSVIEVVGTTGV